MITLNEFKRRFDKEWEKGNISGLDSEEYKELQKDLREPGQRLQQIEKERKLTTDPQKLDELYYDRIYTGNKYHTPRTRLRDSSITLADMQRRRSLGAGKYGKMVVEGDIKSGSEIQQKISTKWQKERKEKRLKQAMQNRQQKELAKRQSALVPIPKKQRIGNRTEKIQNGVITTPYFSEKNNNPTGISKEAEQRRKQVAKSLNYTPTTNTPTTQTISNATSTSTNSVPKIEPKSTSNTYAPSGNDVKKATQPLGNAGKRKYTKTMMEYWNNLGKGGKAAVRLGTAAVIGGGLYGGYKLMNRDRNNTRK